MFLSCVKNKLCLEEMCNAGTEWWGAKGATAAGHSLAQVSVVQEAPDFASCCQLQEQLLVLSLCHALMAAEPYPIHTYRACSSRLIAQLRAVLWCLQREG